MRTPRPLYAELAALVQARLNCGAKANWEWRDKHEESIDYLVKNFLPSGSGVDHGTTIDLDRSTGERLYLGIDYHHMNDGGMYDGWTSHEARVTPSFLGGFSYTISGRNRNDIKEYLGDLLHEALSQKVWQVFDGEEWTWTSEYYYSGQLVGNGEGI